MSKLQEAIQDILAESNNAQAPNAAELYEQVNQKESNDSDTEHAAPSGDGATRTSKKPTNPDELSDPAAKELAAVTQADSSDKSEGSGDGDNASDNTVDFDDNDDEGLEPVESEGDDPAASDDEGSEGSDDTGGEGSTGDTDGADSEDDEPSEDGDEELGGEDEPTTEEASDDAEQSGEPEGEGEGTDDEDVSGEETPDEPQNTDSEESEPEAPGGEEDSGEESSPEEEPSEADDDEDSEEADPEVGGKDPDFDEEGNLKSLEEVEEAASGKDDVSHAASVVNEAKELSDRLGDLARELIEREGIKDASTEAIQRVIRISVESIQDRAELLVGETVNVVDGEDPYFVAIQKAITHARNTLRTIRNFSEGLAVHAIGERAKTLRDLVAGLEGGVKDVPLRPSEAKQLAIDGALNLEAYAYANKVQTLAKEITDWLRGSIGPYLISASRGEAPGFNEFRSSLVTVNPELAQRVSNDGVAISNTETSILLPGTTVFTYVKGEGYPDLLTIVPLTAKSDLPTAVVLPTVTQVEMERMLTEMSVYGSVAVKMLSIINQMFEVLANIESWVNETYDEDQGAVKSLHIEHLVTAITLPLADVFYLAYKQYVAINGLFTAIEDQQSQQA